MVVVGTFVILPLLHEFVSLTLLNNYVIGVIVPEIDAVIAKIVVSVDNNNVLHHTFFSFIINTYNFFNNIIIKYR